MGSGYVLNFSDRTFSDFVWETVGKDIYEQQYAFNGNSKAKRLRAFWEIESNYTVSILLKALIEYWREIQREDITIEDATWTLRDDCWKIAVNLGEDGVSEHVDHLVAVAAEEMDFTLLAKTIRDSIEKNEPGIALDRLHTYVVKYLRKLCQKHGIATGKDKPLHSIFGEYIKLIDEQGHIETEMTRRILKTSISLLDAFNPVRNDKTFAHDNPLLNYDESMLIFKNISALILFVESIEKEMNEQSKYDLPF
nr:abortive infection family protein [Sporosarcina luteola]